MINNSNKLLEITEWNLHNINKTRTWITVVQRATNINQTKIQCNQLDCKKRKHRLTIFGVKPQINNDNTNESKSTDYDMKRVENIFFSIKAEPKVIKKCHRIKE